jgi:hypothetical protein
LANHIGTYLLVAAPVQESLPTCGCDDQTQWAAFQHFKDLTFTDISGKEFVVGNDIYADKGLG